MAPVHVRLLRQGAALQAACLLLVALGTTVSSTLAHMVVRYLAAVALLVGCGLLAGGLVLRETARRAPAERSAADWYA